MQKVIRGFGDNQDEKVSLGIIKAKDSQGIPRVLYDESKNVQRRRIYEGI